MEHLVIEQSNITESVSAGILTKLYEIAKSGDLYPNSNLKGTVTVPKIHGKVMNYLMEKYPELTIIAQQVYVDFIDPEIEKVCAQQWGDGIGVTAIQAAAVTVLPNNIFEDNQNIEDFSDFSRVFPNCTTLGSSCFKNSSIRYFDFSNIQHITDYFPECFRNSQLEGDINMPLFRDVSILRNCFRNTKITSISNLGSIQSLGNTDGQGAFWECANLTSVVLPSTIRQVHYALGKCYNLETIEGEEYIEQMYSVSLYGTGLRNTVLNFANLTDLGCNCFGNRGGTNEHGKFGQIYAPKVQKSRDWGSDYDANSVYAGGMFLHAEAGLVYLRDLTDIHPAFASYATINALVINNTTPPRLQNTLDQADTDVTDDQRSWTRTFRSFTGTIYVPDSALSVYQNDVKWSTLGLTIRGMSELSHVATEEAWIAAGRPANTLIDAYM